VGTYDFDVVIIGTGPGGEGAAMQAVKCGKKVGVIERFHAIGGNCTHRGTIPSKALRFAIHQITEVAKNPLFPSVNVATSHSFPDLLRRAEEVISKQVSMRKGFYERNRIPLFQGHAKFIDEHTVEVDQSQRVTSDRFVVATGSRPFRPADVDFSHPRILDSDTVLGLRETPKSIVIYGAGVIGCEYASMFRNLGCKVNLINTRERLLEFLDDEITDALSYHLRDRGCLIRHNEQYQSIAGQNDGVVLALKSGKQVRGDVLLWANGRTGNTQDLGLESVGITADKRGYLKVNEHYETEKEGIYAVGDLIGFPSLASAAYTQGRHAASHILGQACDDDMGHDIPTGIYTSPEISSVGRTEKELTDACIPYEVGHVHFKSLARAQITGRTVGMLKLLFHRETLQVLGVHCFGASASEIVHIGQAIMAQPGENNTLLYFINTTFNYPTMAEAYRVAALNGYNRLF
jgi:NAD(P) transhydrogenase